MTAQSNIYLNGQNWYTFAISKCEWQALLARPLLPLDDICLKRYPIIRQREQWSVKKMSRGEIERSRGLQRGFLVIANSVAAIAAICTVGFLFRYCFGNSPPCLVVAICMVLGLQQASTFFSRFVSQFGALPPNLSSSPSSLIPCS